MNLFDCLSILANPKAQGSWESAYDELATLPKISDAELLRVLELLETVPDCDYSLVRLFCVDLLDRDSIPLSKCAKSLGVMIEQGNDTERSMALRLLCSRLTEIPLAKATIQKIDTKKMPFLFRWQIRRALKGQT